MKVILPILLLLAVYPALAAPRRNSPVASLQRRMSGQWRDAGGQGIKIKISPNRADGGTIDYWRGRSFYERSPYRVLGSDTIKVINPKITYRVQFGKAGMVWSLPGSKRKPRRFVRITGRPVKRV